MKLRTIIISWVICGALSVYAAGAIDKARGSRGAAPVTLLFIMGPFSLVTCGIMAITPKVIIMNPILKPLYDLGGEA